MVIASVSLRPDKSACMLKNEALYARWFQGPQKSDRSQSNQNGLFGKSLISPRQ